MGLTKIVYGDEKFVDVKFSFKRNLLGIVKGVNIEFIHDHIFLLNIEEDKKTFIIRNGRYFGSFNDIPHTDRSIFINKAEMYQFAKRGECSRFCFYTCAVSADGQAIVTIEPMAIKNEILGKNDNRRRVVSQNILGQCEVIICDERKAKKIFDSKLAEFNEIAKEQTIFDRFMKKYFSFYKYVFRLRYNPYGQNLNLFDRIMYEYFSFYK